MNASKPASFSALFSQSVDATKTLWKSILLGNLAGLGSMAVLLCLAVVGVMLLGPAARNPNTLLDDPQASAVVMIIAFVFVVCAIFVGWGMGVYMQVLAVERKPRVRDTLKRVPSFMLPLAYTSVWMFIRSMVWLPMVVLLIALLALPRDEMMTVLMLTLGMVAMLVLALVFMPRFVLAPAILIGEGARPSESVSRSMKYTSGYWGKVVGNFLLLGFLLWIVSFALQSGLGGAMEGLDRIMDGDAALAAKVAAVLVAVAGFVLYVLASMLVQFVQIAFLVEMTKTLKRHPKA